MLQHTKPPVGEYVSQRHSTPGGFVVTSFLKFGMTHVYIPIWNYSSFARTIFPLNVPWLIPVPPVAVHVHVIRRSMTKLPLAPAKRPVPPVMVWVSTT